MNRPTSLLASLLAPIPAAAAIGVICFASWVVGLLTPYPTTPLTPMRALALVVAAPAAYLVGAVALYFGGRVLSYLKLLRLGVMIGAACLLSLSGGIYAAAVNALDSSDVLVYVVAFGVFGMLFTVPTTFLWWRIAHNYASQPTASGGG
jgi:hypothetical protein